MTSARSVLAARPAAPLHATDGGDVRAVFVLPSLTVGGSETKTVRVVNALLRRGVLAGIAYLNQPHDLLKSLHADIPVWHLRRRGKFSPAALGSLRQLIRERRPQAVLAVNLYPALYVSLATAAMSNRPRTACLINTTQFPPGDEWRTSFYRPFLRSFDTTVYGCELQRSIWLSRLGYPRRGSHVIYNGVDTSHFIPATAAARQEARQRHRIGSQAFVVGTVGRLAREKNQAVLVDAVAELRWRSIDAHLLLVGEGRMRAELERRVAQQAMQRHVTFAGTQGDVRPALSAMDVFVLPSTHVETFSNAALEAMAMGKPVVLSRIGGAAEMVSEGVAGFTLDTTQLQEKLVPLLARLFVENELRERMGQAARARAAQEFSLQTMVSEYAALIDAGAGADVRLNERPS